MRALTTIDTNENLIHLLKYLVGGLPTHFTFIDVRSNIRVWMHGIDG